MAKSVDRAISGSVVNERSTAQSKSETTDQGSRFDAAGAVMYRAQRYLLMAVLLAAPAALAKQHPVPLDKNTDAAKCIECHGDKAKGKVVHSAIATGCTSCH